MRILFLTNFFPPKSQGGYEMWAYETAVGLRARGHDVCVLTSRAKIKLKKPDPEWIQRKFLLEMDIVPLVNSIRFFTQRASRERENLAFLRETFEAFQPDIVMIWGMWNLQRSLSAYAEEVFGRNVVYYVGDYWMTLPNQYVHYWDEESNGFAAGVLKEGLRPLARRTLAKMPHHKLNIPHALFPTGYMRDELTARGIVAQQSEIVTGAVDLQRFIHPPSPIHDTIQLLWIGRLTALKGVKTAIDALALLVHTYHLDCKLTLVGKGEDGYEVEMAHYATALDVAAQIEFMPFQPTAKIIDLCQQSDILLFTSIWPEPFGRVLVEAMAAGMVVVGTGTGGSAEIMTPENSLQFEPEDTGALAAHVAHLQQAPDDYLRLAHAGQTHVLEHFDSDRFTEKIEHYLEEIVVPQHAS